MKTTKTWIAAVLTLMMVLGMAGCLNRGPTAKTLMAGIPTIDLEKYNDLEIEMEIITQADGQTSSISVSARSEGDGEISHLYDMEMSFDVDGVSMEISMEAWMERHTDLMYSHLSMSGEDAGWLLLSSESYSLIDSLAEPTEEMHTFVAGGPELVLEPHTKGEDYVVTWTESASDAEDFSEMLGSLLFEMGGTADSIDQVPLGSATAHAHFDEKTHDLKLLRIEAGADSPDSSSSILVVITYHTLNGTQTLEIPRNVKNLSVDVRGLM